MYVDETKIFYIDGIPVAFPYIMEWWESRFNNVPVNRRSIPDPRTSEKVCLHIANLIVGDMRKKIGGDFAYTYTSTTQLSEEKSPRNALSSFVNDPETAGIDWIGDDVIDKAFKILEERWKKQKEEETRKRQEQINFWKKQQTNKQYSPPPPPKEPVFSWRIVLGFGVNEVVTEEEIKKRYRKEAFKRHPDRGGTDALINELFKARDLAYRFLGKDPP